MRLFLLFFKKEKWQFFIFISTVCIFILIPFLYSLPLDALLYAGILGLTVFILVFLHQYIPFIKKQKVLWELTEHQIYDLDRLPEAMDSIEQSYLYLIKNIFDEKQTFIRKMQVNNQDAVDYYSLWVHQVKTPIAAMRLLLQTEDNPANKELEAELFKIEQYVEMALQYLRMNTATTDYRFEEQDLDTMMRNVIRKYASQFIRRKLAIQYETLNYQFITDEKWFTFVIEQIISNALKYTKTGSIHIYMEPSKEGTLIIEDTGMGIKPEDLPRIFEKGYTGYNGRMDKKATGIGLYLSKQILDHLSHKITILSKPGEGTKVCIDLSQYKIEKDS